MATSTGFAHFDEAALLDRLTNGLIRRNQEVVFLVGSALSAPTAPGLPGVPTVEGIIDLVRAEFQGNAAQIGPFEAAVACPLPGRYHAAFQFLLGRRGQQAANDIIREAVLKARTSTQESAAQDDQACRLLEEDITGWALSPSLQALGKIISAYPQRFGNSLLTTNFDPLIQLSIKRASGDCYKTVLQADGGLFQTKADGCHVIHLHGYWYGADTLHTPHQLLQPRPRLKSSLSNLLKSKLIVVCGYGGWDDIFSSSLMEVIADEESYPDLLWLFHGSLKSSSNALLERLRPGINRGRVTLYSDIDCHHLFPSLLAMWQELEKPNPRKIQRQSNPVRVEPVVIERIHAAVEDQVVIEGRNEDRPPVVEVCVGRDEELRILNTTNARVVYLNGLGGQGKSTVAAKYFTEAQTRSAFTHFVWRDCKEESERFENQIIEVIERFSDGKLTGEDLSKQDTGTIIEVLINIIAPLRVLFVFDNVDHYVDLESNRLTSAPEMLATALLSSHSASRAIFTCRPTVTVSDALALTLPLEGLSLRSTMELFAQRGAPSEPQEIEQAHEVTEGHAFWLDLLAVQVAMRASVIDLSTIVNEIKSGGGPLPTKTLSSVWTTLKDREQLVLRTMAETVKPESELEIADYLSGEIGYSKVIKALKTLRALNLVVVKQRPGSSDLIELHPLVRQFIRQNFAKPDRVTFVDRIIKVYEVWMGRYRGQLTGRAPLSTLEYWTQGAELDISVGKFNKAFTALAEVAQPFSASSYTREFPELPGACSRLRIGSGISANTKSSKRYSGRM